MNILGKRGPPPTPANVLQMRGTHRKDRERELAVVPIAGKPVCPGWISEPARSLFLRKVDKYIRRGQIVVGVEDALAHYCEVEADIIDKRDRRVEVAAAELNVLIRYQALFYDAPGAQVKPAPRDPRNPFLRKKPPATT